MRTILRAIGVVVLAQGFATASLANSIPSVFSSFFVFGDSLSDPGNLATLGVPTLEPASPYADGRFSNGPVWAEYLSPDANFAFGGASTTSAQQLSGPPSVQKQVGLFAQGLANGSLTAGARPLAAIWAGANDIFWALDPSEATSANTAAQTAAANIGTTITALQGLGVNDFLIFNLPDFGLIPRYNPLAVPLEETLTASAATSTFNAALDSLLATLPDQGARAYTVDIEGLFDDLIGNVLAGNFADTFGILDPFQPCVIPNPSVTFDVPGDVCSPTEQLTRAFFDPVHPNSVVHQKIALEASAALAPAVVPLPMPLALLLAGLGGFVLVKRRAA